MWFDLRLLGLAMRNQAVSEVFDDFRPWMLAGFAIMFLTGFLGREGWTKRQFQPGDQITITVFPPKQALLWVLSIGRIRSWLMVKKR